MSPSAKKVSVMEHILENFFGQKPNSPLHSIMDHNGYTIPEDFFMEKDEDIDLLEYPDSTGVMQPINKGNAGLMKIFKQYIAHEVNQGKQFSDDDWRNITKSDLTHLGYLISSGSSSDSFFSTIKH